MDAVDGEPAAFLRESGRVAGSLPGMEDHPYRALLRQASGTRDPLESARLPRGPAIALPVARVASVGAVHRTFESRAEALSRLVAEVGSVRARVAEVRVAEVRVEVARDHPPVPGEDVAGALDGLRARFPDVAESDVAAVARAREVSAHLTGSLHRRAELRRGRLDAYRAEAAGRGFAEDAGLSALHREARDVLFSAPRDLNAGTVAVVRYQRAVPARTEGR